MRLDALVLRAGFARTRSGAQHGHRVSWTAVLRVKYPARPSRSSRRARRRRRSRSRPRAHRTNMCPPCQGCLDVQLEKLSAVLTRRPKRAEVPGAVRGPARRATARSLVPLRTPRSPLRRRAGRCVRPGRCVGTSRVGAVAPCPTSIPALVRVVFRGAVGTSARSPRRRPSRAYGARVPRPRAWLALEGVSWEMWPASSQPSRSCCSSACSRCRSSSSAAVDEARASIKEVTDHSVPIPQQGRDDRRHDEQPARQGRHHRHVGRPVERLRAHGPVRRHISVRRWSRSPRSRTACARLPRAGRRR